MGDAAEKLYDELLKLPHTATARVIRGDSSRARRGGALARSAERRAVLGRIKGRLRRPLRGCALDP